MKRKQCREASHASFPSLVVLFMGDKMIRQFAVQTTGCGIGAVVFACASAVLGLSGAMLYKAT